jgi:putative acyl-CoA dehydrogenase
MHEHHRATAMSQPSTITGVLNQSPPFVDIDLFKSDIALQEAVAREGGGADGGRLAAFGLAAGSRERLELGRLANENPPRLRSHDARGQRLDVVEYHPAYHRLMQTSIAEGLHASVWSHLADAGGLPKPGAHVARAAAFYMAAQVDAGHCCPITMTNASLATLQLSPELTAEWLPRLLPRSYDPSFRPSSQKSGVTIGMGMTERQGGTDVRANITTAEPTADGYRITGHKWFMSAPMSDAFLILAQTGPGPTCFLLPRFLPDGSTNALRLIRLKDKLGNRSNASCEVELDGATGWRIGEEGRGVPAIIEMVTATRLDCAVASAGLMRLAVAHAIHHAEHRMVFQRRLSDQPVMMQVLADLALEVEAAVALSFRLARSFDLVADPRAAAWRRVMTPVTKYLVCKLAPGLVVEAMECMGGNGYVEELPLARIYREVPVNAIWEGAGNVMALDLLRVLQREPQSAQIVMEELAQGIGEEPTLKAAHARVLSILHDPRLLDARARQLTEGLGQLAAAALLRAHAPTAVADAYIATRLSCVRQTYGQGLERCNVRAILARATPTRS